MSWSNPNDTSITKYQVRHKADSSFADGDDLWEDITGSGSGTTSHTVTGLTNGTEYVFQIRAVSAGGTGEGSDEKTATPQESAALTLTGTPVTVTEGGTAGTFTCGVEHSAY